MFFSAILLKRSSPVLDGRGPIHFIQLSRYTVILSIVIDLKIYKFCANV